ncbi:TadE/TadG family type IV pilus assembly protein [Serratia marcescens]|uniref:TadE/TadG family type IV pilus assembly protein n=1 Tax=Serratia TaxID=613 RepID=UPI00074550C0|nr:MULTISPECIES: pilus assembly protein [Serratia]MBH3028375.1 pilus assembly protein [Serratia marcescens]MBH3042747.1 pilus assembly protein [Serratia marcescens]MBH3263379.1 pilus assembly protein [Serratia marcescens]MBN5239060.1 pilus assembly protein [Serratia marcescens]MBN5264713.1 pilus assembly protein [Serratia marcescens]
MISLFTRVGSEERGISTIEASVLLPILFIILMMIYEVLRFQNDISIIYFNEEFASQRVDLSFLDNDVEKINENFLADLNKSGSEFYFSALLYSEPKITCYEDINIKVSKKCGKKTKLINIAYQIQREYSSDWISDLLSFPQQFDREVFIVNDYFH